MNTKFIFLDEYSEPFSKYREISLQQFNPQTSKVFIVMKSIWLSVALLTFFQGFSQEKSGLKNCYATIFGKIGGAVVNYPLYFFENDSVIGSYIDDSCKKHTFAGRIINNDSLHLFHYEEHKLLYELGGRIVGQYNYPYGRRIFAPYNFTYKGLQRDSSGRHSKQFILTIDSLLYGGFAPPYHGHAGTEDEIESFMKQVKNAIVEGDKEWLADHLEFPFNGFENIDRSYFLHNFDDIITIKYRNGVKAICPYHLWSNSHGISMDNIWIKNTAGSTLEKYDFIIIVIN